jgi:hypothetical protein
VWASPLGVRGKCCASCWVMGASVRDCGVHICVFLVESR